LYINKDQLFELIFDKKNQTHRKKTSRLKAKRNKEKK